MKKNNKALRVAAGLAVAAMLSTCLVSGTFAKYTTSGNIVDSARVAKFGVEVAGNAGAFTDEYSSDNGLTVKSTGGDVVAPGTEGTFRANTITGKPEVAVHVENSVVADLGENWTVDGVYYCPLEVTVGATTIKGTECTSVEDFENKIAAAVKKTSADYAPNADITAASTAISWKWAFTGNDDAKDTKLGDAANATVSFNLTTTVTQVD